LSCLEEVLQASTIEQFGGKRNPFEGHFAKNLNKSLVMSRRGLTALGLVAAGGAGYYLYNAGGDPKVAQKQVEADVHKASAKIQGEAVPRGKEAGARGEAFVRQAGDKFDQAAYDAEKKFEANKKEAEKKLHEGRKEAQDAAAKTSSKVNQEIDKFDKTVTEKASQAKSGISSWFGGK